MLRPSGALQAKENNEKLLFAEFTLPDWGNSVGCRIVAIVFCGLSRSGY